MVFFIAQNYSVTAYIFHLLHKQYKIPDKAGDNQEIHLFGVILFLKSYMRRNFVCQFFIKTNKQNEKDYSLVFKSADRRNFIHSYYSPDDRFCIFLRRHFKICLRKPGRGQIYQTWFSNSRNHCSLCSGMRNCRRFAIVAWFVYKDCCILFYH
jgi:hypothetical protein